MKSVCGTNNENVLGRREIYHREYGCEITLSQFGQPGCTLPYIMSADCFNRQYRRQYERNRALEIKQKREELDCSTLSFLESLEKQLT